MSQVQVRSETGQPLKNISIRISIGQDDSDAAIFDIKTDPSGNQGWPIPFWLQQDYTLHVNVQDPDARYLPTSKLATASEYGHDQSVVLSRRTPPRLTRNGRWFADPSGQRVTLVGATCFQSYDRYLRQGENELRDVFSQLEQKGFNAIRIFGMDHHIPLQIGRPPFRPQDFGTAYYDELPAFCAFAARYGMYVYFVVFADTGLIMPNEHEQREHFGKVWRQLATRQNTLLSAGNELRQHDNFVDVTKLERPVGILSSAGSEGMDEPTHGPWWDFDEFHPRRDYPSAIKDCCLVDHPNYGMGLPMVIDEPDRFGSQGNPDAVKCGQQAGASRESAAGMVFHSKNGVYAIPMDAQTEPCADAFMRAFQGANRW